MKASSKIMTILFSPCGPITLARREDLMLTQADQERLVGDILRASFEALTLKDFGPRGLPMFERLFKTSNSLLYQCNEARELVKLGGPMEGAHPNYTEQYYASHPMQSLMRRENPWIMHGPRYPEWKKFLKLPVYTDHAKRHGIDNYIHLRLNEYPHNEPKMAGLLLARSARQPDFTDHEVLMLARILPALETLTRRSARMEERFGSHSIVESVLEMDPRAKIAFDPCGAILWASEKAEALLGLRRKGRWVVPHALLKAVHKLGRLLGKDSVLAAPCASVPLPGKTSPLRAELRLARTRTGALFVLAELDLPPASSPTAE